MANLTVKQPADEVPTEVMADAIVAISDGIQKLRAGRLGDKALLLLIQHAMPMKGRPTVKQIKAVLDGAADLKLVYLKRKS